MKYFLHDTNAFQDEKITELFLKFGYEGLGLFYTILEKIGMQEKPIKTSVLKAQLKVGKRLEKCWSFMEEIGIISSSNGETFNERILSYSETYQIKKEKTRKRVEKFREQQHEKESFIENGNALQESYKRVSNAPKVKESKVKEIYNNIDVNSMKKVFVKPTKEQVIDYFCEIGLDDFTAQGKADQFMDYYTSNGWKIGGKTAMKDWQAAVRSWKKRMNGNHANNLFQPNEIQPSVPQLKNITGL